MAIKIQIQDSKAQQTLNHLAATLTDTEPMFREIANILHLETMLNFEYEGRPRWLQLADSTKKSRLKKNRQGNSLIKILQDKGILANSIMPTHGRDFAMISTNVPYADVQHSGATINHPAGQRTVRLATNKNGSLRRQSGNPNLAVFARNNKPARESTHASKAYTVTIPARPYMPFKGTQNTATLQPEAEQNIYEFLQRLLRQPI